MIGIVMAPLVIFNLLEGAVAFVWLICLREWRVLIMSFVTLLGSSMLLSFALLPGILLVVLGGKLAEKRSPYLVAPFIIMGALYQYVIMTIWCLGCFFVLVNDATDHDLIPRLLCAYGLSIGPWAYFASGETDKDSGGIAILSASVACLVIGVMIIRTETLSRVDVIVAFCVVMVIAILLQGALQVGAALALRRRKAADPELL
jgi:hypothetical protein